MRRRLAGGAREALVLLGVCLPAAHPTRVGLTAVAPLPPLLASITPTFQWSSAGVSDLVPPVSFRLRIARDSAFTRIVVDTTLVDVAQYDLRRPLKPYGPIFWRVDATASNTTTATTGAVGPIAVPAWAILTALNAPGGTTTADAQPTFTWRSPTVAAPPGPLHYDLFVRQPGSAVSDFGISGLADSPFQMPTPLARNTTFQWALVVHVGTDTSLVRSAGTFLVLDPTVPNATLLYQNFPNPFPAAGRDSTCLWFDLATTGFTELTVVDLRGAPVRHFVPGPHFSPMLDAGRYGRSAAGGPTCDPRLMWDGRTDDGRPVPAGVYLYKLQAGGVILFKRIVFLGRSR